MTHYKMSNVAVEVNDRENNPASSKYDRFVGLEHYVSGEVIIRNYGSTENLESTMKIFQSGDVLVARRNVYLKRASMVDFDGLTSGDSIVLRAKNPVIGRILPFVLNTDAFWDFADQYSDGTMSKRLSPKTLMTYEFDLPDEDELEKFADLLWAANDTRESYQALLRQTDELVKSQFIGAIQPLLDEGKTIRLDDIIETGRPITYGILKPGSGFVGGIPVVKVKDMQDGVIDQSNLLLTSPEIDAQYQRSKLRAGDLLITIRGSVGRMAEVPENLEGANITQDTARLTISNEYNKIYIRGVLESAPLQLEMERNIRGVAVKGINIGFLRELQIPICDRGVQDRLAGIYEQTDKSKFEIKKAIENTSALIKSLMQQDLTN